jgi:Bacterial PH domain
MILSSLTAAVVIFVLTYLIRSARTSARKDGNAMVVEYGRTMKIFTIVFWLFVVVGVAAAYASASASAPLVATCVIGGFFFMVLVFHLEVFHVVIRYDADGLHLTSPWRRSRFIPWSAITGARFSSAYQWYVLSTTEHGFIRLHLFLSGLQSLLDELATRGVLIPATDE